MPPKKKLHVLCVEVAQNTAVNDTARKKQFLIGKQFATGGFGRIYTCKEANSSEQLVLKVEPSGNGPLFTEVNVFNRILKKEMIEAYKKEKKIGWIGVPYIISAGIFKYKDEDLRYMVMPKYACSLESLRETNESFSEKEAWTIARAITSSLEYIHFKKYVHADIKAANILLEKNNDFSKSVLVDYGLARLSANNEDKPDKKRAHNGTAIFTSRDAHRGCHPSYRGDIEILAYNILYWMTGSLPWLKLETTPDKVHAAKNSFYGNLATSIKQNLGSNAKSQTGLLDLFKEVDQTSYAEHVNFSKIYKIIDKVLSQAASATPSTSAKLSRKRPSKDESIEEEDSTVPVQSVAKRTKKTPQISDEGPTPRRAKTTSRTKAGEDTSPKKNPPRATRNKLRILDSDEEPDEPINNVTVRVKRSEDARKAASFKPLRTALLKRRSGVVPGLLNGKSTSTESSPKRISKSSAEIEEKENKNVASNEIVKKRTVAGPTEKIKSPILRSPNQLRQKVPGMRNFPKGRRSIVINQITKKYRRLAAARDDSS